jgi:hypothetical protein
MLTTSKTRGTYYSNLGLAWQFPYFKRLLDIDHPFCRALCLLSARPRGCLLTLLDPCAHHYYPMPFQRASSDIYFRYSAGWLGKKVYKGVYIYAKPLN